jgi:Ca-activated chloride channel family protein
MVDIDIVPPREYVFIVDVSGSMNGFPISISKDLIETIIRGLRAEDYFNILFFAGGTQVLSPHPLPATEDNKELGISMLRFQRGSGSTRILNALNNVLSLEKEEGLSRIIVISTDGYVVVEKQVFDLISENLGEANFFSFGIGNAPNRYIIEGMARVGRGEPFVVTNSVEAWEMAEKFLAYVKHPLLNRLIGRRRGWK